MHIKLTESTDARNARLAEKARKAEALRVAVYEYSHSMANTSAYRVRAAYSQDINERAEFSAAALFWGTQAEQDKAKLADLGVIL